MSQKLTDLTYLQESFGDDEFIKELIEKFLEQTPAILHDMSLSIEKKEWFKVGEMAHKIKPSLKMFGLNWIEKDLKEMELLAKSSDNIPRVLELWRSLQITCDKVFEELRAV